MEFQIDQTGALLKVSSNLAEKKWSSALMGYGSTFQPFLFVFVFVQKSLQKIEENKGYFRKTVF
jgi:hypothetical protein